MFNEAKYRQGGVVYARAVALPKPLVVSFTPLIKLAAVFSAVIILLAGAYRLQCRIDAEAYAPLSERLLLSIPAGDYLKSATFGFEAPVADLLWAHTVVTFGQHFLTDGDYTGLYHALDIITTLDPRFNEAYRFGAILLAMQANQIDESMMLAEKGLKQFPDDWRLHFILGFNWTYFKGDDHRAIDYFERAAELPGHPPYLPRLIGNLYADTGKIDMALMFLEEAYKTFKNEKMRAEIGAKIKELVVQKQTMFLTDAVQAYKRLYGKYPETLEALVVSAIIPEIPEAPDGGHYTIDPATGAIRHHMPDSRQSSAHQPTPSGKS